jgi:hypothetical protein
MRKSKVVTRLNKTFDKVIRQKLYNFLQNMESSKRLVIICDTTEINITN